MAKQIIYGEEARKAIERRIEAVVPRKYLCFNVLS